MWVKTNSYFKQIMWLSSGRFVYSEHLMSGERLYEYRADEITAVATPKDFESFGCSPNIEPEKFDIRILRPELRVGDFVEFKCGSRGAVLKIRDELWILLKDSGWCDLSEAWNKGHSYSIVSIYRPKRPVGFQFFGDKKYGDMVWNI